jgi:hypothetical protein
VPPSWRRGLAAVNFESGYSSAVLATPSPKIAYG